MSDALLDYSSWSFQLITFLAVLYLILGLIHPAWVMGHQAEHNCHRVGDRPAARLDRLLRRGASAARRAGRPPPSGPSRRQSPAQP